MAFVKGQSGNPNGRPKADPDVIARLRELTPMAVEKIAQIAQDDAHKNQFAAAESIVNRVLGMPKQPIGLEDDGSGITGNLSQFMAIMAGFATGRQGSSSEPSSVDENPKDEPNTA